MWFRYRIRFQCSSKTARHAATAAARRRGRRPYQSLRGAANEWVEQAAGVDTACVGMLDWIRSVTTSWAGPKMIDGS